MSLSVVNDAPNAPLMSGHQNFLLSKPHVHPLTHLPDPWLLQLLRSLFQAEWCPHAALGWTDTCRTEPADWLGITLAFVLTRFHTHPVCGSVDSLHGNSCAWSPIQPESLAVFWYQWLTRKAPVHTLHLLRGAPACFTWCLAFCTSSWAKGFWRSSSPEHHSLSWKDIWVFSWETDGFYPCTRRREWHKVSCTFDLNKPNLFGKTEH